MESPICLICKTKQVGKNAEIKQESEDPSGNETRVTFILLYILEVPPDIFAACQGNPGEWGILFCETCSDAVDKANSLYEDILKGMRAYKKLKENIIEEMKNVGGGGVGRHFKQGAHWNRPQNISGKIREFVVKNDYCSLAYPFQLDELEEEDKLVKDVIGKGAVEKTQGLEEQEKLLSESIRKEDAVVKTERSDEEAYYYGDDIKIGEETVKKLKLEDEMECGLEESRGMEKPNDEEIPVCNMELRSTAALANADSEHSSDEDIVPLDGNTSTEQHAVDLSSARAFTCVCGVTCPNERRLSGHIKYYTSERSFQCPFCPLIFCRKNRMSNHMYEYHRRKNNDCLDCGKTFPSMGSLGVHQLSCNGKTSSPICNDGTSSKSFGMNLRKRAAPKCYAESDDELGE